MKIAVIGSINMDYSVGVNALPLKGETIMANAFHLAAGGKGANQAVAARRLGAEVHMVGALGKDGNGKELYQQLDKDGIHLEAIKYVDTPTGNAMITVEKGGSNTIVVFSGANGELDEEWVIKHKNIVEEADFVILQLEIPMKTVAKAVSLAKQFNKQVILNPAPATLIPDEIYKEVDYITPNETELALLTGTHSVEEGAKILLGKGVKTVVVTLGEKGCYYLSREGAGFVQTSVVNAVDTTAAGDAFNGALAVALGEGKSLRESLVFANKVGALATTKNGAQDALPMRSEVDKM